LRNKRGKHCATVDNRLKINKTVFGSKKIEKNTSVFLIVKLVFSNIWRMLMAGIGVFMVTNGICVLAREKATQKTIQYGSGGWSGNTG
jgi:hypothetical protein